MRTEIFSDQLERQTMSKRMLLFKRGALTDERKAYCQLFSEHREDCKNTLDEARNKLTITPEYVERLEADMKVRASELQAVKDSNKRTPQEGGDAEMDERDEFMNDVRRRRAQFQKELDDQSAQLEAENKLCTSLVERMNQHIKNLEDEVQNAAVEDHNIRQFNELIETDTKLLMYEETKRAIWAQVEDVYSVSNLQEKDEDMMMTSQIWSLLQQLAEAFVMLTNHLLEEEASLQHASTQLEDETNSIHAFMERMESEKIALCTTEKTSLAKESQVRRFEADLIEQRARALIDSYKQIQAEHMNYPIELGKREKVLLPREADLEEAKRLIKNRNYYDRKAFKFETLKAKGKEINWEQDTL
ncbi:hypothetical protein PsorP6_007686 [Peronosclerospora sorghi]|uniref:Uncharacterized protein n=1 Tax=Peronosclerospora sorghi TaxID=230839 RepID=A0ACC0WAK9_9STRA|nr:hypothetical protein PsorP6_007686 [Peronosclerospora sorghi]